MIEESETLTNSEPRHTVVKGIQWGDEGKGKIVAKLSKKADLVVRYQGGANAGHTVEQDDGKYILHLFPTGILQEGIEVALGPNVVPDLRSMYEDELSMLINRGANIANVAVSPDAHVTTRLTLYEDLESNRLRGIGSTIRGIGPTYGLQRDRFGIQVKDVANLSVDDLVKMLEMQAEKRHVSWQSIQQALTTEGTTRLENAKTEEQTRIANRFAELITFEREAMLMKQSLEAMLNTGHVRLENTGDLMQRVDESGGRILLEGAQGVLLDPTHGNAPYTTSSDVATGENNTGYFIKDMNRIGVAKAYVTKVGGGKLVTIDEGSGGRRLQELGGEFGATTGRRRNCGWFDIPAVRYAVRVSGIDEIVLNKLDILSHFSSIPVAVGHENMSKEEIFNGPRTYVEKIGWAEDITGIKYHEDLPRRAKDYIEFLQDEIGVFIRYIGNGAHTDALIERAA